MVNGAEPVPLGERSPLGLRDRHQWHRISAPLELGQIPTCQGSMQGMELLDDMVELEPVQCNGIPEKPRLTQGPRHRGEQLGTGAGVATGEQHHVMPPMDQVLREAMHDPLCTSISTRRNTFTERQDLCDPHFQDS